MRGRRKQRGIVSGTKLRVNGVNFDNLSYSDNPNEFLKNKNPNGMTLEEEEEATGVDEVALAEEKDIIEPRDERELEKNDKESMDEYVECFTDSERWNGIKWTAVVVCILISLYLVWLGISEKDKVYFYGAIVAGVVAAGIWMLMTP